MNFSIDDQYIGLMWGANGYADLHNDFDFHKLIYNPAKARLELEWCKSLEDCAQQVKWQKLKLIFEGVEYLMMRQRDATMSTLDDITVAHLCRTSPDNREDFDNIYFHCDARPEYDLLLLFESGWAIKVNAASVRLQAT